MSPINIMAYRLVNSLSIYWSVNDPLDRFDNI